ncbi:BlaI/MecI/CopY family transcriptional regulator [Lapillicoccus sp.]|uniref:BlaI/MecI/CopY family transcriptional regulator n=1 Tax=Lapillicoccus sp. TaxID=1909287 RepID=UPI003983A061
MARQLGELEAVVMDRLWTWERPTTVREVLDDLIEDRKLAYTTVMTVMDNLHRKGVLSREPDGRAYRYSPVRTRADHTADLIASVLSTSDDRTAPLLRFVEQMDPDELARLRAALERLGAASEPPPGPRRRQR